MTDGSLAAPRPHPVHHPAVPTALVALLAVTALALDLGRGVHPLAWWLVLGLAAGYSVSGSP